MKLFFQVEWYLLSSSLHLQLCFISFIFFSFRFKISLCSSWAYLIQESVSVLGEVRMQNCPSRGSPLSYWPSLDEFCTVPKNVCLCSGEHSIPNLCSNLQSWVVWEGVHKCSQIWIVIKWQQSQTLCSAAEWRNIIQTIMGRVERSVVSKAYLF